MEYNLINILMDLESKGKKSKYPALTSFLEDFLKKNPNDILSPTYSDPNYTENRLNQVSFPNSYTYSEMNAPNPHGSVQSLMDAGVGNTINVLDLVQQGNLLQDLLIKQYQNANILGTELKGMQTKDVDNTLISLDKITKMINSALSETEEDRIKNKQEEYIKGAGEIGDF
tara:strand:+ start:69 stop:581 length:513 start_codon:yes stop_codon:yes gene_type:complete